MKLSWMTGSSINRAINKNCSLVFMSNKYQPRRPGVLFLIGMITCGVLKNNLASNSLLKGFIFFLCRFNLLQYIGICNFFRNGVLSAYLGYTRYMMTTFPFFFFWDED